MSLNATSFTIQGHREYQEDRYINENISKDIKLFAIFDGHGGDKVSEFCKNNIVNLVKQELYNTKCDIPVLLRKVFSTLDKMIYLIDEPYTGSTAVVCIITKTKVFFANAGDSMAMIKKRNNDVQFTTCDHKVNNPSEYKRIIKNQGVVSQDRVMGTLNIARSLGDFYLKKWVISTPAISSFDKKSIKYIVLGSDGVWDEMNIHHVDHVVQKSAQNNIVKSIVQEAFERGSTDNITATFISID